MKIHPNPERCGASGRRTRSQRGSALLIVFVFAAFVAIMLYREMPVFAFEAQRQKEQMLIDRGTQYKRGVKLFYKKFGMYPASIEQLENTNRLRFLRHRFKDPFTGKDDWRLLHMGPGGMLIDSKVNPLKTNDQAGNASGFGTNSGFGSASNSAANSSFGTTPNSTANSGFGSSLSSTATSSFGANSNQPANSAFGGSSRGNRNSGFGSGFGSNTNSTSSFGSSSFSSFSSFGSASSGSASNQGGVVVQPVPKRPPAVASNGSASTANAASAANQNGVNQPGESAQAGQLGDSAQVGQLPDPGGPDQTGQLQPVQNNGQAGVDQAIPAGGARGANSMNAIRRMLTNPNAQAQGLGAGTSRVRSGGGLAGVASKAQGQTIKVVNDQLDYALWEFYYDPSKDVKQVTPGGTGLGGAQGAGANTFNRAVTNPNPQTPINPPPPSPAPAVAPAEPPQFEPNPNPSSEIPPPDEPPNPDNPNPDNPNPDNLNPDNPNPDNTNPDNNNPDNNNPNDTPAEPPQLRL